MTIETGPVVNISYDEFRKHQHALAGLKRSFFMHRAFTKAPLLFGTPTRWRLIAGALMATYGILIILGVFPNDTALARLTAMLSGLVGLYLMLISFCRWLDDQGFTGRFLNRLGEYSPIQRDRMLELLKTAIATKVLSDDAVVEFIRAEQREIDRHRSAVPDPMHDPAVLERLLTKHSAQVNLKT